MKDELVTIHLLEEEAADLSAFAQALVVVDENGIPNGTISLSVGDFFNERGQLPAELVGVAGRVNDDHEVDIGLEIRVGLSDVCLTTGTRTVEPDREEIVTELCEEAREQSLYDSTLPRRQLSGSKSAI